MPKKHIAAITNIDKIIESKPVPKRLIDTINRVRSIKPKFGNIRKVVFVASKKQIISGNYNLPDLKTFSKNTGVRVLIPNYAEIENGNIKYLEQ